MTRPTTTGGFSEKELRETTVERWFCPLRHAIALRFGTCATMAVSTGERPAQHVLGGSVRVSVCR